MITLLAERYDDYFQAADSVKAETITLIELVRYNPGPSDRALEMEATGVGIPAERQQTVFEAFQQADNSISRRFGGTGLGLTISRSLLGLQGFGISLRSRHGHGTVFTIGFGMPPMRGSSCPIWWKRRDIRPSPPRRRKTVCAWRIPASPVR